MKKNVPKFVLAKNEAATPGATYVVHTQEPSFIAEIKRFGSQAEKEEYLQLDTDVERIEVRPLLLVVIKKYLDSSEREQRRESLHKRLKDWIVSNYIVTNVLESKP